MGDEAGRARGAAVVALCLAGLLACRAPQDPPPSDTAPADGPAETVPAWFEDATADVGLDFVHDAGVDGSYFMPEILGPGGALFDADGDGLLDVYLVNGGRHDGAPSAAVNRLYRQEAGADGGVAFVDVTAESGAGDAGFGMGCAVGDVDNDGDLDLYVTNFGADALYLNESTGDGPRFRDVTAESGIVAEGWSTSAGFFDYDGDGLLDLYVVRYVDFDPTRRCTTLAGEPEYCGPQAFRAFTDLLFRNLGDHRFADVSAASGIAFAPGRGLGVAFGDFDDDGREDVFVANDGEKNQLWLNRGDGTFSERAVLMGVAVNLLGRTEANMGVAVGDVENDGDLDLFVTHLDQETNTLYLNAEGQGFEDRTAASGLGPQSLPYTGFGTGFFDADLDADLDLLVVNGKVRLDAGSEQLYQPAAGGQEDEQGGTAEVLLRRLARYAEPNFLYENTGVQTSSVQTSSVQTSAVQTSAGRFVERSGGPLGTDGHVEISRGAVYGDVDRDGDLDALVTNAQGPARLYRNVAPRRGRWFALRAVDPALQRDAVGAVVRLEAGGRSQIRHVTHTYGYLTASDATAHFGVGEAAQVDRVTVRWPESGAPDGRIEEEIFGPFAVDQTVVLRRGEGTR